MRLLKLLITEKERNGMVRLIMSFALAILVAKHSVMAFAPRKVLCSSSVRSCTPFNVSRLVRSKMLQRIPLYMSTSDDLEDLRQKIKMKGDEIRQLKNDGIAKDELAPHVAELLALKSKLPDDVAEKPKQKQKEKSKKKPSPAPTKKVKEMSASELRLNRLSKVGAMRDAELEPFEYTFDVTHSSAILSSEYDGRLEPGEEDENADVAVAGRIMTRRVFGKLAFFTLQDESGTIQLQFDKKRLGDSFKVRQLRDV